MPNFRYTIKELQEESDTWLLCKIINERLSTCTNPYTPLVKRLKALKVKLQKNEALSYDPEDRYA
jgi:hypothetical protein